MRHFLLAACLSALAAGEIAVWDPGIDGSTIRFTLSTTQWQAVAGWIREAGLPVARLDYQQLRQPGTLDPARHPVLVMSAHLVPIASDKAARAEDLRAYLGYLDRGGVILGLGSNPGPGAFGIGIEAKADGWALSPPGPGYAWQLNELREALGIRYVYNPALHDLDTRHEPTALLRRYWPEAPTVQRKLPQVHQVGIPVDGSEPAFHPLYDSLRFNGAPTIPAVYVARAGRRTAIIENNPGWCAAQPEAWFPHSRTLTLALVRLALDLQAGKVDLTAEARRSMPADPGIEPLGRREPDGQVDPDRAERIVRWGRFDGANWELGEPAAADQVVDLAADPQRTLPRRLDPGGTIRLPLPERAAATWLRLRFAYTRSDAALAVAIDGRRLHGERLVYASAIGEGNGGIHAAANQPAEINRIVFVPPGPAGIAELTAPGSGPLWFDAVQLERRGPGSPVLVGWNAPLLASFPGGSGKFRVPPGSETFGALRCDARLQFLGPPGDPQRWAKLDEIYGQYASFRAPLHLIIFGTPEWMAVPESLAEAKRRKRAHICVPEQAKFVQAVGEWLDRYGARCAAVELMNEVDIKQFWIGTPQEYVALCNAIIPLIRAKCPGIPIISHGSAAQNEDLLVAERDGGMLARIDWVANHCYAGQSVAWEMGQGMFEGHCYAHGIANPIFANEQGFVWTNCEWFTGPPAWTPERQSEATDISLARLMATGQPRVIVFTAGGDNHGYAYCDAEGRPRPGYRVVMDYHRLNGAGAVRADLAMSDPDGGLLRGVYSAASELPDGSITAILNPCQAGTRPVQVRLLVPLPDRRPRAVSLTCAGQDLPATMDMRTRGDAAWLELNIGIPGRSILQLKPRY